MICRCAEEVVSHGKGKKRRMGGVGEGVCVGGGGGGQEVGGGESGR